LQKPFGRKSAVLDAKKNVTLEQKESKENMQKSHSLITHVGRGWRPPSNTAKSNLPKFKWRSADSQLNIRYLSVVQTRMAVHTSHRKNAKNLH
jgi:hypothetical protein